MEEFIVKLVKENEWTKRSLLKVKKELKLTKKRLSQVEKKAGSKRRRLLTRNKRITDYEVTTQRSMSLQFRNKISRIILTGEKIKGEDKTCIEIALVNDATQNTVDDEPESSMNVEIVVLRGEFDASETDDWTSVQFNENIVPEVEGKQPLLAGNVLLKLQKGVAILDNIKFRNHASKIKPSVFRLGARVVAKTFDDSAGVKEAMTESFTLKEYRLKYSRKHKIPSLSDEVFRLINIQKRGANDKRLQAKKICTVKDFLTQLDTDPEGLKSTLKLRPKEWDDTVSHARACLGDTYNIISQQHTSINSDVVGQSGGLSSENHYSPTTNMLSGNSFGDEGSQYSTWTSVVHPLIDPYYPFGGCKVAIGESSNARQSNSSFQDSIAEASSTIEDDFNSSLTSAMTTGKDRLSDYHAAIIYSDAPLEHPPSILDRETLFPGFDDFLKKKWWNISVGALRWWCSLKKNVTRRSDALASRL